MKIKNRLKYIGVLILFSCDPDSEEASKKNDSAIFDISENAYKEYRNKILNSLETIRKQCNITKLDDYNNINDMIDNFFSTEFKSKCNNHEDVDNILVLHPNINDIKNDVTLVSKQKKYNIKDEMLKNCGETFFKKLSSFLEEQRSKIQKAKGRMIGQDTEIQKIFYESFKEIIEILVNEILKQSINNTIHDSLVNWQKSDKKTNPLSLIKTIIQ